MDVVQMAIDQVVDMIPMRNRRVTTVRAVNVRVSMSVAVVARRALLRINRGNLDAVLVHMVAVRIMQVPIVKIIRVAIVFHRHVTTFWAVLVAVSTLMLLVNLRHR
jgi:hypothetical protein